jgi:hypothetical protein
MSIAEFYIDNGIDPSDPESFDTWMAAGHSRGSILDGREYAGLQGEYEAERMMARDEERVIEVVARRRRLHREQQRGVAGLADDVDDRSLDSEEATELANQQFYDDMEQQRLEAEEAEAMANQQYDDHIDQQRLEAEEAEAMANQQYDDDVEQQLLEAEEAEAMANQQFYDDMEQQQHLEVEEDDQWDGEDNEDDMG